MKYKKKYLHTYLFSLVIFDELYTFHKVPVV